MTNNTYKIEFISPEGLDIKSLKGVNIKSKHLKGNVKLKQVKKTSNRLTKKLACRLKTKKFEPTLSITVKEHDYNYGQVYKVLMDWIKLAEMAESNKNK